jgi:hypothetical protein
MRPTLTYLGALAIFAALSIAIFGAPLMARGFSTFRLRVWSAGDPQIYMWGLAWYPYALAHRLDPLETAAVWAPTGFNLAWATTIPAAALAAWPLTRFWGLIPAYNCLTLFAPTLASFTAFVLFRCVTGGFWPAIVGGAVFGFSPYMQEQMTGHLHLVLVFIVPLLPYPGAATFARAARARRLRRAVRSVPGLSVPDFSRDFRDRHGLWRDRDDRRAAVFPVIPARQIKRVAVSIGIGYAAAIVALAPFLARFFGGQFDWLAIYNPAH